jgi:hypothetical protein
MNTYINEAEVAALVNAARRGDREERSGSGLNGAVVRSLSRATGHNYETVATALVLEDAAALFNLPPTSIGGLPLPRLHGDVRALGDEERR